VSPSFGPSSASNHLLVSATNSGLLELPSRGKSRSLPGTNNFGECRRELVRKAHAANFQARFTMGPTFMPAIFF
jgi:hypothetical protein